MKKIILLILLITQNIICAQDNNFSIHENNLIWQKVYNENINQTDLIKQLQLSGKFDKTELVNNNIDFSFKFTCEDVRPYGYKNMSDAIYFIKGGICTGNIEFKDSKYRVTIFKFDIYEPVNGYKTRPLSDYVIKKGSFRKDPVFDRGFDYLNQHFTKSFSVKSTNDKW